MPFPLTRRGEVQYAWQLTGTDLAAEAARLIADALQSRGMVLTRVTESGVDFRAPLIMLDPALRLLSDGSVSVNLQRDALKVSYELSFTGLVLSIGSFCIAGLVILVVSTGKFEWMMPFMLALGFVWLVGPAYLITPFVFRRVLRRALRPMKLDLLPRRSTPAP